MCGLNILLLDTSSEQIFFIVSNAENKFEASSVRIFFNYDIPFICDDGIRLGVREGVSMIRRCKLEEGKKADTKMVVVKWEQLKQVDFKTK